MLKFALWYLRVFVQDYEMKVGDGAANKVYDWWVKNYIPEKEWKELLEMDEKTTETIEIMEDR